MVGMRMREGRRLNLPHACLLFCYAPKLAVIVLIISVQPSTSTKSKIVGELSGVIVTQTSILESLLHETLSRATSRYLRPVNVDKIAKKRISTCVENSK